MSSFPYVPPASIFNTLDYRIVEDSGISLAQADARYFQITGGYVSYINSSEFYLNGSPLNFTLLTDITAGTVQANKLIAVDSNRDITNFRNISLSGTLIASNDISSPIINSNQYLLSGSSILTSALTGIVTGTASASKALVLDSSSNIVGINSLSATNLNISGTLSLPSLTSVLTAQITDTNNASISYPLTIQHLLSSGSPTDNAMKVGLKFEMPNSINVATPYGAISAEVQQHASGLHQGQLNFYSSFAGNLVNAMTLSSLTSPTNNVLILNGATSLFSAYRLVCDNILCNSNISISKATLPNLTITSTSSSTLSQLLLVTNNQTWELGARGSTASNPNSFYIYNGQLNMVMSPAGVTQFLNTNVSLTSTSNAFQLSGGLYTDKAILNNSYYNCDNSFTGNGHGASTNAICLNDQAIFFRGQNAGDTNHGLMYSGNGNANWNSSKGFGNPSTAIDGPVLFGNAGVMIGNLSSSSTETICATFIGNTTNLFNTVNIAQPPINIAKVNINSPTGIGIINDSTHYATIGCDANGSVVLTATSGGSYSQYYFSHQNSLGLANIPPRSRLDFGNTFNNCIITLYQANSSSGTYQIGCNNSAIQYTSNGSNGHQFYYNSTTTPQALGTIIFSMLGNGVCQNGDNFIAGTGVHANSFSTTGLAAYGMCAHMHYSGNSVGNFFTYNYNTATYGQTIIGNNSIYSNPNGTVGIQTAGGSYPLEVNFNTQTVTTYGYLTSSGTTGTSGSSGAVNFSAKFNGRIAVSGEIDVYSDIRLKENIVDLDEAYVNKFMDAIKPKIYNKKISKNIPELGYIAQDIVKNNINELYMIHLAEIEEVIDNDGFINPKNNIFTVNYQKICCILHKKILMQDKVIEDLRISIDKILAKLESDPTPVESDPIDPTPAKLKRVVKKLNRVVYSSK